MHSLEPPNKPKPVSQAVQSLHSRGKTPPFLILQLRGSM